MSGSSIKFRYMSSRRIDQSSPPINPFHKSLPDYPSNSTKHQDNISKHPSSQKRHHTNNSPYQRNSGSSEDRYRDKDHNKRRQYNNESNRHSEQRSGGRNRRQQNVLLVMLTMWEQILLTITNKSVKIHFITMKYLKITNMVLTLQYISGILKYSHHIKFYKLVLNQVILFDSIF